jgi:hypothetical protein
MSGFEPLLLEAGAAEVGTTALASEVLAPELLSTLGSEFGTEAAFSGLGGLGGMEGLTGLTGLTGEGLGSLAGTAQSAIPTLAENLATAAPEALAQTQQAVLSAQPGATQLAQPMTEAQYNFLHNTVADASGTVMPPAGEIAPNVQAGSTINAPYELTQTPTPNLPSAMTMEGAGTTAPTTGGLGNLFDMIKGAAGKFSDLKPEQQMLYGGAGLLGANALFGKKQGVPAAEKYSGPLSKFHYNPSSYTPYVAQPPTNPYRPVYTSYAHGGLADLGGYSDGGRMLKGPGDGMSDDIPATIANKQPARLANEEFVVPADVVSHLGNGSSEAGAKQLYKMMDRVRQARTGNKKQGKQINPEKYLA